MALGAGVAIVMVIAEIFMPVSFSMLGMVVLALVRSPGGFWTRYPIDRILSITLIAFLPFAPFL